MATLQLIKIDFSVLVMICNQWEFFFIKICNSALHELKFSKNKLKIKIGGQKEKN